MIAVLIASVLLLMVSIALFSLRILFLKNGDFRGTCAGNSSFLKKEGVVCGVCGRSAGEPCGKEEEEQVIGSKARG